MATIQLVQRRERGTVVVTGATGYVGGRLVSRLIERGRSVRCLVRDPSRVAGRPWADVEIVACDLAHPGAADRALTGAEAAYYLVHSMGSGPAYRERDAELATAFADAAARDGLRRIVYLGGLGDEEQTSHHLASRHEVGRILASSGVPTVELRAAVIVGSGSASFEIIRHLTERLPLMVTPKWLEHRCQPIGIRSVLDYLVEVLGLPGAEGVYEIGGPDVLTYRDMILEYARARGLRRLVIPAPVPHPEWSSRFIDIFTPVPYAIAQPLVQSLQSEAVVRDDRARREFSVLPMGYSEALSLALARVAADEVETTWASSVSSAGLSEHRRRTLSVHEGMLLERYRARTTAPPGLLFEAACGLGGDTGWLAGNWLWHARGLIDRFFGGVGMRRGRRHPRDLLVGEPVDFWRVEAIESGHLLRLRAEMKMPGTAWLQFEVVSDGGGARVEQTAFFDPHGLLGYVYWYGLLPFHRFIFPGLITALCKRAEEWSRTVKAGKGKRARSSAADGTAAALRGWR